MVGREADDDYGPEAIARELIRQGEAGDPVGAQVFFADAVPSDDLARLAADVIHAAEESLRRPGSVVLVKVRALAKSASVRGDPEVIAAMQGNPAVKSVLPNVIADILPAPIDRKGV